MADPDPTLYIEPTVGVRSWRWDASRKRLISLMNEIVWEPGEPLKATCSKAHATPAPGSVAAAAHDVPVKACTCGVYAVKTLEHLRAQDYHNDGVLGLVQLWGRMLVGTKGYRAANAYPLKLYVPHLIWEVAEDGLKEYGVPIALINPFRADLNPEEGAT